MYAFPKITKTVMIILIANAVGFLFSIFMPKVMIAFFGLSFQPDPFYILSLSWKVFTYQVVGRTNIVGLLFFALFMWWVGSRLEEAWGTKVFVMFYLIVSAVSGILSLLVLNIFGINFVYGSTGITFAIIGVFAYLQPNLPFYIFGIFPVKVKWLLLVSIILTLAGGTPMSIVYFLTLQLITGLVAVIFMFIVFPLPSWLAPVMGGLKRSVENLKTKFSQPKKVKRNFKVYSTYSEDKAKATYDKPEIIEDDQEEENEDDIQREVDRILDKISKYGRDSLTKKEKDFLDNASKNYNSNK